MVYLLVYSNSFGDREELSTYFSACSYIDHWRYDLPNSFYLVSDESARCFNDFQVIRGIKQVTSADIAEKIIYSEHLINM